MCSHRRSAVPQLSSSSSSSTSEMVTFTEPRRALVPLGKYNDPWTGLSPSQLLYFIVLPVFLSKSKTTTIVFIFTFHDSHEAMRTHPQSTRTRGLRTIS